MLVSRSNRSLLASSLLVSLFTTSILGCTTANEPTDINIASSTTGPSLPVTVTANGATQQANLKLSDVTELEAILPSFKADGITTTDSARVLQAAQISVISSNGTLLRWTRSGNTLTSLDDATRSLRWNLATGELEIRGAGGSSRVSVTGGAADIQRVIGALVRVGAGDSSADVLATLGGGEVVIIIVGIAFTSWLLCLTAGQAACGATAIAGCGFGNVEEYQMNCGINLGSVGGTDAMVGDVGSLGVCTFTCKDDEPDPNPPTFPHPGLPLPPTVIDVATLGNCPEGMRMDFCIVGWDDSAEYTDGEVTVETTPEVEPCCVPDGVD